MQYYYKTMKFLALSFTLFVLAGLVQTQAYAQSDAEISGTVRVCQQVPDQDARLACYDRILPPGNGTAAVSSQALAPRASTPAAPTTPAASAPETASSTVPERRSSVVPFFNQSDAVLTQIVEVEQLSLTSSRVTAADGTIFVQTNSNTVTRWPDTPFNVEVQRGAFGTVYLWLEESRQRVRVAVE